MMSEVALLIKTNYGSESISLDVCVLVRVIEYLLRGLYMYAAVVHFVFCYIVVFVLRRPRGFSILSKE